MGWSDWFNITIVRSFLEVIFWWQIVIITLQILPFSDYSHSQLGHFFIGIPRKSHEVITLHDCNFFEPYWEGGRMCAEHDHSPAPGNFPLFFSHEQGNDKHSNRERERKGRWDQEEGKREKRWEKSGAVCLRRMNENLILACWGDETGVYSLVLSAFSSCPFAAPHISSLTQFLDFAENSCLMQFSLHVLSFSFFISCQWSKNKMKKDLLCNVRLPVVHYYMIMITPILLTS